MGAVDAAQWVSERVAAATGEELQFVAESRSSSSSAAAAAAAAAATRGAVKFSSGDVFSGGGSAAGPDASAATLASICRRLQQSGGRDVTLGEILKVRSRTCVCRESICCCWLLLFDRV
jgi:hypothetical protein